MIILCLSFQLFSVDLSSLPETKRYEYLRNSLSIDFGSETHSSLTAGTYYGVSVGEMKSKSEIVWTPYLGGQPIAKTDFFSFVGEPTLAANQLIIDENNRRNKIISNSLYGVGFSISGIGLIYAYARMFSDDYSEENEGKVYSGLATALGGLVIAAIGYPFELKSKQSQNLSTSFLVGLTENHNLRLLASLSK